jgi:iron complex outermembrane receptor protein
LVNQGWVDTEGWDLGVNYRLPEFAFGRFAVHWSTTYTSHLNTKTADDAEFVSPGTSFAGNFRIRSNASLDWSLGDFGATWGTRYYSSQKEKCSYDKPAGRSAACRTTRHRMSARAHIRSIASVR